MNSGERAFVIADWIFIVGITPFAYSIASVLLLNIIDSFFMKFIPQLYEAINSGYFLLLVIIMFIIGLFIVLISVIKNKVQKNRMTKPMKNVTNKFLFGVFLIYMGHLGLALIYTILLFAQFSLGGTVSGLFAVPAIPWMFVFYSIGYNIVNKQKLLERLRARNEFESHT